MKHFRLFFLGGYLLDIPALLIIILFSFHPVTVNESISIPPGDNSYGSVEANLIGGGPIRGAFESVSGNDVSFMILDEDQFSDHSANLSHGWRFATVAASGSFSAELLDMERCYFVAEHATNSSSTEVVQVTYELDELNPVYLMASMGIFVASGVLIVYAIHTRTKERVEARIASSMYLDVVFFDDEKRG